MGGVNLTRAGAAVQQRLRFHEVVMNAHVQTSDETRLMPIIAGQQEAFSREGAPTLEKRRADLLKLKHAILGRRGEFEAAISADFGHRPARETAIMEIMPTVKGIDYLRKNLADWMRPRKRHVAIWFSPASAKVLYQPLGVVGILSPWNCPAALCLLPLATAIAAGNRAMVKPSEFSPRTSALMTSMLSEIFPEDEVAVISGGADVGAAFSALPFDHLVFTGSTEVGRAVMKAASERLVPVTLELGGKSPVIVERGFSLSRAAGSIAYGKLSNAGQTCIAPDYALVHESEVDAFVAAFSDAVSRAYPGGASDDAYASIINQRHFERLANLVSDAAAKGARIVEIGERAGEQRPRTLQPTVITGATSGMAVMQQEIFGPILPIIAYREMDDAIAYVNARSRPLALYLFSDDRGTVERVLARTTSGNVSVNDTLLHYAQDDLPFGGVGPSGMGAYHGEEGFRSLSHVKGVFTQSRLSFTGLMRAPFGRTADLILRFMLR
jgi:coniferyl-aldehyde dehydrogenase